MMKIINKYMIGFLTAAIIVSCSPEPLQETPPAQGDVPVELDGMLTRALGDTGDPGDGKLIPSGYPLEAFKDAGIPFFLTARTAEDPVMNYFLNTPITIGKGNDTEKGRNKIDGNAYYPLGNKKIDLYAHTVSVNSEGNISLTAGVNPENDVLLGRGTLADGVTSKTGSSEDPIEFITFKHLMTRVDVRIEEVDEDIEDQKPTRLTMRFSRAGKNGAVVNSGSFNIFTGGDVTNNANAEYGFLDVGSTIQTHYLVPNGANLTTYNGQIVSSLKIDEYSVAKTDLETFRFPTTDKGYDFILAPGLAYDLTFVINHLKITGIKLVLRDWTTKQGNAEWGVEPKKIKLSTGDEFESREITKMVLKYKYTDGNEYQFIGKGDNSGELEFVTLPANLDLQGTCMTADLYTNEGLLAKEMEIQPHNGGLLVVDLGKYGMRKRDNSLEISTPLQLALMVNDKNATPQRYLLSKTIDMDNTSLPLTPGSFPSGALLDGNGNAILHLNINGNGLFTENNGELRNFRVASGLIKGNGANGSGIGAICQTNNGKIEGVVNDANIEPAPGQVAGGICGINGVAGTILASVNSGNIADGHTTGGIVGENKNPAKGTITACLNTGMLNKSAANLGGILGTSVEGMDNGTMVVACFWLTGTARKNQAANDEMAIGNNPRNGTGNVSADLTASSINTEALGLLNNVLSNSGWYFVLDKNVSPWPFARAID